MARLTVPFQVPTVGLKLHNVGRCSAAQTLTIALRVCAMDYRILTQSKFTVLCVRSFTSTVITGTTNCHVLMSKYIVTHHVAVVASECHNSRKNRP